MEFEEENTNRPAETDSESQPISDLAIDANSDHLSETARQKRRESFFGQEDSKKVIFTMIEAAKKRGEQPGQTMLNGYEDETDQMRTGTESGR